MLRLAYLVVFAMLLASAKLAFPSGGDTAPHHAQGSFTVELKAMEPAAAGLKRVGIEKTFSGGIEGRSEGEMISAGDPRAGAAGYVAMETVTGKLDGRAGSFALQQFGTMEAGGQKLEILVVPGSGTGALAGLQGKLTLVVKEGQHSYDLAYTLP